MLHAKCHYSIWTDLFEFYLSGNPEDRNSYEDTHISVINIKLTYSRHDFSKELNS